MSDAQLKEGPSQCVDGIMYHLRYDRTTHGIPSFTVLSEIDTVHDELHVVRTPGRWVLLGNGRRYECFCQRLLFMQIAKEIHG